jgi:serine/threonine protein kinase
MIGERIHQYTIVEKIGEGGMGTVWKARDERLGRFAALKFLARVQDSSRFTLEARAASSLSHPGIVTIYDVLELGDRSCIAMEFVDGKTLHQMIPRGGMEPRELIRLATQIADALAAAHKAGIVHRDIKPANIMVTPEGRAKVLDFGLAKMSGMSAAAANETRTIAGPHTAEGTIVGTVSYMSPEQAEGKAVDTRSDVFSLGTVLYEMATGRKAFEGNTTISTITAILRDQPKPLSGTLPALPRELERVITRCLRKEPDRRFQTALDIRNALEEIQEDWKAPPSSTQVAAPALRSRQPKSLWIAVALAGLGFATWSFNRSSNKPAQVENSIVVRTLGSLPGLKDSPSFSPDGNAIVMTWNSGELGKNDNVYAMLVDSGKPLRLSTSPEMEGIPFYSPDGRRVLFSRRSDAGVAVYAVPALGGDETRIADGTMVDVSPDGQWALIDRRSTERSAGQAYYVTSLQNGQERVLLPRTVGVDEFAAKFSPDGKWVYFTKSQAGQTSTVMRIPFEGGTPEPARFPALDSLVSHVSALSFARTSGVILVSAELKTGTGQRLFLLKADGSDPLLLPPNVPAGKLSPDGRRMISVAYYAASPLYRVSAFPHKGEKPDALKALDTHRGETSPKFSPNGSRVAVSSTRNNKSEVWVWDAGFTQGQPVFRRTSNTSGSPAWSPDGQSIAFDARVDGSVGDIWIVRSTGESPRQLTNDPGEDIVPCFDPTGEWIYFTSGREGELQIFKMPRAGGPPTRVTKGGGFTCQFSPDGKFLYYLQTRNKGGIWRLELASGKEEPVLPEVQDRNWKVLADGIYLLDTGVSSRMGSWRPGEAMFYRFANRRIEKLGFITPRPVSPQGIDISPDRKSLLFSQADSRASDLQLTENLPIP